MGKCLLCLHYDVVNFECKRLQELLELSEPVRTDPDWGCKEYKNATAKNVLDNIKITIDVGI